jgi:hypothetical protein
LSYLSGVNVTGALNADLFHRTTAAHWNQESKKI